MREYSKSRRERFKKSNLCRDCGKEKEDDRVRCRICREKYNDYHRRLRHTRIKNSLCLICKTKIKNGRMCSFCKEKNNKEAKRRREENIKRGLCAYCGSGNIVNKNHKELLCEDCYFKRAAKRCFGSNKKEYAIFLKEQFYKQKQICPFTGIKLELGKNASVEHIKPRHKYPNETKNFKNVVWVHYRFNEMKKDMELEDFIDYIKNILKHYKATGEGISIESPMNQEPHTL